MHPGLAFLQTRHSSTSISLLESSSFERILEAQKPAHFLKIPAEIRNKIYKEVLRSSETFTITRPSERTVCDTGLLCVNKQILSEASSIFYAENVFCFPSHLFDGAPILAILDDVLPAIRLMTLKKFLICVTVGDSQTAVVPAIPWELAKDLMPQCSSANVAPGPSRG